jgi:hypothetical protein
MKNVLLISCISDECRHTCVYGRLDDCGNPWYVWKTLPAFCVLQSNVLPDWMVLQSIGEPQTDVLLKRLNNSFDGPFEKHSLEFLFSKRLAIQYGFPVEWRTK